MEKGVERVPDKVSCMCKGPVMGVGQWCGENSGTVRRMVHLKNGRGRVGWNSEKEGEHDTRWGQKDRQSPDHSGSF